jgi:long-chain acyl-CoA synthetase
MVTLTRELAATHGDRAAIIDERGRTSWAELDDRVNRLVEALRARGLVEGDTVVLMAGNQREALEATLACLHGGWLVVPVNWHWVADEVAYVLGDCEPKAVIVDRRWVDVVGEADSATQGERIKVAIDPGPPVGFEAYEDVLVPASGDEPDDQVRGGVMFYTSGTTGRPKGVRGGLTSIGGPPEIWQLVAATLGETLGLTEDEPVQLVCGPIYHSAQWVFALAPLLLGATVVLQHRFDAEEVLSLIDEHGVTGTHLVPAQFVRLLRVPDGVRRRFSGASLRRVHHGAAPCPQQVKRQMIEWWGPIITEYYGGTEGGFITTISAEEWQERPTSVGRPIPTVDVLVVGDDGQLAPPGTPGDLYFRSKLGVDFEYHNAEEKTAQAHLEPGVGTLGDVGWLDEDGYLHLSDRRIDMIISGGVNIYPAEIESVLGSHPSVADVAVFGIPDDEMGERVMAAVVPAAGVEGDDELVGVLEAHVRDRLAGYKVPRRWTFLDELPRTESGKLLKRQLREPFWAGAERAM